MGWLGEPPLCSLISPHTQLHSLSLTPSVTALRGDDVLLTDPRYFLPFLARAMSYVDVHTLSRDLLVRVTAAFPESADRVRKAAIRLAFRRHVIAEAKQAKDEAEKERLASLSTADAQAEVAKAGGDFLDRVHDAATVSCTEMPRATLHWVDTRKS